MKKLFLLLSLTLLSYAQTNTQQKGVLVVTLKDKQLMVVSAMNNDAPTWYVSDSYGTVELTNPPNTSRTILSITLSPKQDYILVCSHSEGHPVYDILKTSALVTNKKSDFFRIDPYPEDIEIVSWKRSGLLVKSILQLHLTKDVNGFYTPAIKPKLYRFNLSTKNFTLKDTL